MLSFCTLLPAVQVCFGTVVSMGQVTTADDTGKWGALVACSPALHGLSLDLLPQQDWHGAQLHHGNSLELCQVSLKGIFLHLGCVVSGACMCA